MNKNRIRGLRWRASGPMIPPIPINGDAGDTVDSEDEVVDALGEICNMIAGNFASGEAGMKAASQAAFDRIAAILQQGDYRLRIEGHTDNTPIHNLQFPSNWELSAARATEIVRLLIVRDGFAPERLSAAGCAEYHPVASNRTLVGRGMNRRVDIVILGHAVPESGPTPGVAPNQARVPVTKQLPADKTAKPSATVAPVPADVRAVDGRLQQ